MGREPIVSSLRIQTQLVPNECQKFFNPATIARIIARAAIIVDKDCFIDRITVFNDLASNNHRKGADPT